MKEETENIQPFVAKAMQGGHPMPNIECEGERRGPARVTCHSPSATLRPLGLTPNHESLIPKIMERDNWSAQAADIRQQRNLSC
jgi:hypothetical protein